VSNAVGPVREFGEEDMFASIVGLLFFVLIVAYLVGNDRPGGR
jgi:hypothetical protein